MKKNLLLFTIIFLSSIQINAQNIFSNPDFELYSSCPVTQGEAYKAIDWLGIIQSPDYMNCSYTCWTGQDIVGANSGTGYMGFASYNPAQATEAIAQQLTSPLIAGNTYNISLYAKKTTGPSYIGNCGGVCFYGWNGNPFGTSGMTSGICPEDSGGVVLACTDTVYNTLWQPYTVSFIAPAAYDFIGIAVACQFDVGCGQYVFIDDLSMVVSSVKENEIGIGGVKIFQEAGGYLNVSFSLLRNSNIKFSLVNVLGEIVFENQKKMQSGMVNEQFSINDISGGVYFFKIESDNTPIVKKVYITR